MLECAQQRLKQSANALFNVFQLGTEKGHKQKHFEFSNIGNLYARPVLLMSLFVCSNKFDCWWIFEEKNMFHCLFETYDLCYFSGPA